MKSGIAALMGMVIPRRLEERLAESGVLVARGEEDMRAIRRLRYSVYIEEMGLPIERADHEGSELWDLLDATANHLIVRRRGEIVGCVRIHLGGIPAMLAQPLDLWKFPEFPADGLAIVSKLMVSERWRKTTIAARLMKALRTVVDETDQWACFCTANPRLIDLYNKCGMEIYTDPFADAEYGFQYPLVIRLKQAVCA